MVSRIYVEKKPGFDVEAQQLLAELHTAVPEGLAAVVTIVLALGVSNMSKKIAEHTARIIKQNTSSNTG